MKRMSTWGALLILLAGAMSIALAADSSVPSRPASQINDDQPPIPVDNALVERLRFLEVRTGAAIYDYHGRIARVYGKSFSHGPTPEESAQRFIEQHIGMFGISPPDLVARGPFPGKPERHIQPIMYLPDEDRYRFTGVYFAQEIDGVPVFRARTMFLTRNEPNHPLVLVSSDLRDLGGFRVPQQQRAMAEAGVDRALRMIAADLRAEVVFEGDPEIVVWAGVEDMDVQPRLAVKQVVEVGTVADPATYQKWLYLVDALTGVVLYTENMVLHGGSITGNVSCMTTTGDGAAVCHGLTMRPMPYARVTTGSGGDLVIAYADENGDFSITPANGAPLNVTSRVRGLYFRVFNQGGSDAALTQPVENLPASGVDFLYEPSPSSELHMAEVNAYYHSNVVRDFALQFNPEYPVIHSQTEFTVNVNLSNNCNAFYNGTSINFYTSGGGCANTAFSTVVHHEYGHHLVNTGGSGQGAYGEGMSDAVGALITNNPLLGVGFQNNCNNGIRNADNNMQYPCSGGIHFCGQLLSGSVWSTRTELQNTHPSTYLDIISNLTINSILLHTGTSIDPSITIDFLTLDDDDDNIFNGTPHYHQINAGFSKHNMPAPPLMLLDFVFPNGLPELLAPGQEAMVRVEVKPVASTPIPGSALLHFRASPFEPFNTIEMVEIEPNLYDAYLPAMACGSVPEFYFSALDAENNVDFSDQFNPFVGTEIAVFFEDIFDVNVGWIAGAPDDDATTGHWEWGNPIGTTVGGTQVQPNDCFIGEFCWFTGQHTPGQGAGFNDVDHGKTTLFSPILDLGDFGDARIGYQRWYTNCAGANPGNDIFVVDISNDGGLTWSSVEVVGPTGAEACGGWYRHEFLVSSILPPTSQVKLRFVASDYDPQALIEAAIDNFLVEVVVCEDPQPPACPADFDASGDVGVSDLLILLAAWGPCNGCPQDLTGDGNVGVGDLLELLAAWGPCPE